VVVMIPGGNEVITVFSEYSSSAGVTVSTDVTDLSDAASGWSLALLGAWPNPVQARTQIVYTLPGALTVRLSVYDVSGRLVSRLVNERQSAGRHTAAWDTRELSGGTYFYRLEAGGQVRTGRASVVK